MSEKKDPRAEEYAKQLSELVIKFPTRGEYDRMRVMQLEQEVETLKAELAALRSPAPAAPGDEKEKLAQRLEALTCHDGGGCKAYWHADDVRALVTAPAATVTGWRLVDDNGNHVQWLVDAAYEIADKSNYKLTLGTVLDIVRKHFDASRRLTPPAQGDEMRALANALRILLASHDCLAPDGGAEIPEELSARFDIGLDDARQVVSAVAAVREGSE